MQIIKDREKLESVARKFNLELVLLYGSVAEERQGAGSDIDIGVIIKNGSDIDLSLLYHEIEETINLFGRELDLVVINEKDPLTKYEIARKAQLLYGESLKFEEFKAQSFREYLDSEDLRKLERILIVKAQKELIKND